MSVTDTKGMSRLVTLIYFISFAKSMPNFQPRVETLNYCADLKPMRGNFTIIHSEIPFGKWTEGAGTSDEISPPTYERINELQTLRVCSSGRAWLPSGTEASIVLKENSNSTKDTIEIYWNVPVIGTFSHDMYYNESEYTVLRRESDTAQGSNLYEYYLFKI